jgi:aldehyde dehydrogenase (NAD+)
MPGLLLGGEWRETAASFRRTDPARPASETGLFASATGADVQLAYEAAADAAAGWRRTTAVERGDVLRRAGDLLESRRDEAARRLVADMGKAIRDARAEVMRAVAVFRYHAGESLGPGGETYPSAAADTTVVTISEPVGVVCVLTPWNFPLAIPSWKLAPALGCGNPVVWKPATAASGSAVLLTEILVEAGVPPGVLNLVTGSGGELSEALTGDPRLAALTFTGSVATGRSLDRAVAGRGVKVQLELGGKNPAIVLADADLADAADQVARGAMFATGQRCTATSRVYVEQAVFDEFAAALVERVAALRVDDPYDEGTDVGPLASIEQLRKVGGYLDLAAGDGCEVLAGGGYSQPERGFWAEPTVLTGVDPDSPLMRDEIFGPLTTLVPVSGFEEGLAAANDTEFGLSAAIFTRDLGRAMAFAREIEAGQVHINRETAGAEPHAPFGGLKGSSNMQREQGRAAKRFFTNSKTVYVRAR